ncbi:MAG TPA: DUF4252 domain-containing protein [Clostridia bacterium]|nr:DUF4252 domain-containing protein [Clostridia bacterium]
MKLKPFSILPAVALAAFLTTHPATAATSPGRVDFGTFTVPSSGAEFVEINIGTTLISMASPLIVKHEPAVAQLIDGLRSIKVNVIGIDEENRSTLEQKARDIRQQLEQKGWEQVVTVKKQDQDVGIYMKSESKDLIQGLTVVVFEGNKQAVFINVDGNLRPEQLSLIGERLHIEELKKAGTHTKKDRASKRKIKAEDEEQ